MCTMNGNGILKSTDRGLNWVQLPSTLDDPDFNNVSRILVSPTDPDLVVVSTTTGRYKGDIYPSSSIFRSTDGGAAYIFRRVGSPMILKVSAMQCVRVLFIVSIRTPPVSCSWRGQKKFTLFLCRNSKTGI